MEVHPDFSLKEYNTFAIEASAKYYAAPAGIDELILLILNPAYRKVNKLILGGGSNLLFIHNFDGIIIHPQIKGITIVNENDGEVLVKANCGENWDEFVAWTIEQGFGGLENLSLIPGTVGASPIQNIGAYGVEAGDCIEKVEAIDISTCQVKEFNKTECSFGYRNSVFKNELKNQLIITSVWFKLSKNPSFETQYGAVEEELSKMGEINLANIRKAIIKIRESKLPNPQLIPNAGSFFKNPVVSKEKAAQLKIKFPGISSYRTNSTDIKLAAGWIIDHLGWKGKTLGGAGVHDKQALVIVNKENATGNEILELAKNIRADVFKNFGIELEFEVNIV